MLVKLERVFRAYLNDPMAEMVIGITKRLALWTRASMLRVGRVCQLAIGAETEFEIIVTVSKRQQIVIEEVESRKPELNALALCDFKVL